MTMYGRYETQGELHHRGAYTLFSARLPGEEGPPQFVIKVFEPARLDDPEQAKLEAEDFVDRLRLQEELSESPESAFAPLYRIGAQSGSFFGICDLYPRTVQSLIEAKTVLSDSQLHAIISGTLAALGQISAHRGRPHGSLKPSNILISDLPNGPWRALVCDPLPPRRLTDDQSTIADLRALGEIMHALVAHEPLPAGKTQSDSPNWDRLGRKGKRWRTLCNTLLSAGQYGLEPDARRLASAVKELGPKRRRKPMAIILPAAGMALLITLWLIFGVDRRPTPEPDQWRPIWVQVCVEHETWLDPFLSWLAQSKTNSAANEVRIRILEQDKSVDGPKLEPHLTSRSDALNPYAFLSATKNFPSLVAAPVTKAMAKDANQALAIMNRLKSMLDSWPERDELERIEHVLSVQGWSQPAADAHTIRVQSALPNVTDVADRFVKSHDPVNNRYTLRIEDEVARMRHNELGARLAALLELSPVIHEIHSAWDRIQQNLDVIASTGEPMLKREVLLSMLRIENAASPDVPSLAPALRAEAEFTGKLRGAIEQRWASTDSWREGLIDHEFFRANSRIHREYKADAPVTMTLLTTWMAELEDANNWRPNPADDPRESKRLLARLDRIDQDIASIQGIDSIDPGINKSRATIDRPAVLEIEKRAWNRTSMEAIGRDVQELDRQIERLDQEVAAAGMPRDEYIAGVMKDEAGIKTSIVLNNEWISRRDAVLRTITPTEHPSPKLQPVRRLLENLEQAIVANELRLDSAPNDLDRTQLETAVKDRRERLFQTALQRVNWADPEASTDSWESLSEEYRSWESAAGAYVEVFVRIQARLDDAYAFDESVIDGASIESLDGSARNQLQRDPELALLDGALGKVNERVETLKTIRAATWNGLERLKALANGDQGDQGELEAQIAAWRRLGDPAFEQWPASVDDLDAERRIRTRLLALVQPQSQGTRCSEARKQALNDDLTTEWITEGRGHNDWSRCVAKLTNEAELNLATNQQDAFQVRRNDLNDPIKYNLLRLELGEAILALDPQRAIDEDAAKKHVADFMRLSRAMPDAASSSVVVDLLTRLEKALRGTLEGGGAKIGPAANEVSDALRWNQLQTSDWKAPKFAWPVNAASARQNTLEFIRVHPIGAKSAAYVCTTEMPVGLFIEVLNGAARDQSVADHLKVINDSMSAIWSDHQPIGGIRIWEWSAQARHVLLPPLADINRQLNDGWFKARGWELGLQTQPELKFYTEANTDANPWGPKARHPIQYLTAETAERFASLLNCRLPTAAEWKAALDLKLGDGRPDNLADETWKRQIDHMKQLDKLWKMAPQTRAEPLRYTFTIPEQQPQLDSQPVAANDGVRWLREVPTQPDGKFHDLVGNVAEFVTLSLRAGHNPRAKIEDLGLGVIGASALRPSMPLNTALLATGQQKLLFNLPPLEHQFSDVGFRLAFTEPIPPLAERLKRALLDADHHPTGYIWPKSTSP